LIQTERPAPDHLVPCAIVSSHGFHQNKIVRLPANGNTHRHVTACRIAQQGDMRYVRTCINRKPGALQNSRQGTDQFKVRRWRLAHTQPADPVVPPVPGLIENEIKGCRPDRANTGIKGIHPVGWRVAEKGQREMQGVRAHPAAAPVLMQPFSGAVERVAGGIIRPQGEEQPQRARLYWMGFRQYRFRHARSGTPPRPQCPRRAR